MTINCDHVRDGAPPFFTYPVGGSTIRLCVDCTRSQVQMMHLSLLSHGEDDVQRHPDAQT